MKNPCMQARTSESTLSDENTASVTEHQSQSGIYIPVKVHQLAGDLVGLSKSGAAVV